MHEFFSLYARVRDDEIAARTAHPQRRHQQELHELRRRRRRRSR